MKKLEEDRDLEKAKLLASVASTEEKMVSDLSCVTVDLNRMGVLHTFK